MGQPSNSNSNSNSHSSSNSNSSSSPFLALPKGTIARPGLYGSTSQLSPSWLGSRSSTNPQTPTTNPRTPTKPLPVKDDEPCDHEVQHQDHHDVIRPLRTRSRPRELDDISTDSDDDDDDDDDDDGDGDDKGSVTVDDDDNGAQDGLSVTSLENGLVEAVVGLDQATCSRDFFKYSSRDSADNKNNHKDDEDPDGFPAPGLGSPLTPGDRRQSDMRKVMSGWEQDTRPNMADLLSGSGSSGGGSSKSDSSSSDGEHGPQAPAGTPKKTSCCKGKRRSSTLSETMAGKDEVREPSVSSGLLERIPSTSSEQSLYGPWALQKHPHFQSPQTHHHHQQQQQQQQQQQTWGGRRRDSVKGDTNTFELDISAPPSPVVAFYNSPEHKASAKSTRGASSAWRQASKRGQGLIQIVDKSGGAWRTDLVDGSSDPLEQDGSGGGGDGGAWTPELETRSKQVLEEALDITSPARLQGANEEQEDLGDSVATLRPRHTLRERTSGNTTTTTAAAAMNHDTIPSTSPPALQDGTVVRPGNELFAKDVLIIGWQIVGGETRVQKDRSKSNVATPNPSCGENQPSRVQVERGRIGAFVVYECEVHLTRGTKVTRMRRYNDFVTLRDALKRAFPKLRSGGALPKLPPKNNLSKFDPTFLRKRQARLQYWLRTVLLHDQMGSSPMAREWVLAK